MRVMLVYANRTRILEPAPPIGLSYVATATRNAGHEVRFVDLMVSADPLREVERAAREFQPEVVGISVRNIDTVIAQRVSWQLGEIEELIAVVRRHCHARIVLGGPAVSILGTTALRHFEADFAVVGEGEIAFPKLLEAIRESREPADIAGVCFRRNGDVIAVPAERQNHFARSGMERWIRWRAYESAGGAWPIHTKRGCSLGCLYCNYPAMEGHRLRQRNASDVVDEIEHVSAMVRPRTFEFTDSTFNVPENHAVAICEEIIRRKLRVNLSAVGVNPLNASPRLFELMKRAGFCSLVITPDSASDVMLRQLNKTFTATDVRRTAALARESGITCSWFFLLGGPGETCESVEETVSFIETELNWKKFLTVVLAGIRILPGTPLAKRAVAEKYLPPDHNLTSPTFYFEPALDEQWVLDRVNRAIAHNPNVVHGGEQNDSRMQRAFYAALDFVGAAPPFYRFLPMMLRVPPLPALRARQTSVRASCRKQLS